MGIEEVKKFVAEKLKETAPAIEKLKETVPAIEKLKETVPAVLEKFSTDLAMANDWIKTSSEKIHHQIPTTMPSLGTVAVLVVVVVGICGYCCCGGGGKAKTMKAPGRNRRMSRREFEGNPKAYFKNLRSHSD